MQGFPPYRTPGTEARGETYNSSYLLADFLGSAAHIVDRGTNNFTIGTQSLLEVIFKRKG